MKSDLAENVQNLYSLQNKLIFLKNKQRNLESLALKMVKYGYTLESGSLDRDIQGIKEDITRTQNELRRFEVGNV